MVHINLNVLIKDSDRAQLKEVAEQAGRLVGKREATMTAVFADKDGFTGAPKHHFNICLGSVRWSKTQGQFVVSVNEFCGPHIEGLLKASFEKGLTEGTQAYDQAA